MKDLEDSKLHILQIVGEPVGGIRRHVHSVLLNLDSNRFIQSYAYSNKNVDQQFRADLPKIRRQIQDRIQGLPIRKSPHPNDLMNLLRLARYVRQAGVHIVHGHGAKAGLYARLLKRLCPVRVVYTPHGGSIHRMFSQWQNWIYSTVENALCPMTDYFVFESEYSSCVFQKMVRATPRRWIVNPNGLSPDPDRTLSMISKEEADFTKIRTNNINVGIFGMLREAKGQSYAIKAVSELSRLGHTVYLHLFGEGPQRRALEELVIKLGLMDRVIFYGDVEQAEKYMERMEIILIPSLYESFGYIAIEAMRMGKTVIASEVGGLKEIVTEDTGILIPSRNSQEIAKAIVNCIEDEGGAKIRSSKGKERFLRLFSESQMLDTLARIYEGMGRQSIIESAI